MKRRILRNAALGLLEIGGRVYMNFPPFAGWPLARLVATKLRKAETNIHFVSELVDFTFSFSLLPIPAVGNNAPMTIRPAQVKEEIERFMDIIASQHPRVVLEIGTSRGGTLYMLCRIAAADALIISVDLPWGRYGGMGFPPWKSHVYKSFAGPRQKLVLVRGDSHSPVVLRRIKTLLEGKNIDLLFIDGDHSYEGVKRDFLIYSPLVRMGGTVALHDIAIDSLGELGVHRFWDEVRKCYPHKELVKDWTQHWAGIGLLYCVNSQAEAYASS